MPVIKSAKKKLRQDIERTRQNSNYKAALFDAVKKARKKPSAKTLQAVSTLADKAAKKHIIHQNKAARIKSTLAKLLATTAKPTPSKASKTA
jgi:small subunit ribosomal protein S20